MLAEIGVVEGLVGLALIVGAVGVGVAVLTAAANRLMDRRERALVERLRREGWTVHVGRRGPVADSAGWQPRGRDRVAAAATGEHRGRPVSVVYWWRPVGDAFVDSQRCTAIVALAQPHPAVELSRFVGEGETGAVDRITPALRDLGSRRGGSRRGVPRRPGLRPERVVVEGSHLWVDYRAWWPVGSHLGSLLDRLVAAAPPADLPSDG